MQHTPTHKNTPGPASAQTQPKATGLHQKQLGGGLRTTPIDTLPPAPPLHTAQRTRLHTHTHAHARTRPSLPRTQAHLFFLSPRLHDPLQCAHLRRPRALRAVPLALREPARTPSQPAPDVRRIQPLVHHEAAIRAQRHDGAVFAHRHASDAVQAQPWAQRVCVRVCACTCALERMQAKKLLRLETWQAAAPQSLCPNAPLKISVISFSCMPYSTPWYLLFASWRPQIVQHASQPSNPINV